MFLKVPFAFRKCMDIISTPIPWIRWGWVTPICISKLFIIGSENGLAPGRRQAIIWTNDGILLIGYFSEILIEIHIFSFKKTYFKMSSTKFRPFCLCFNVLISLLQTPWVPFHLSWALTWISPSAKWCSCNRTLIFSGSWNAWSCWKKWNS